MQRDEVRHFRRLFKEPWNAERLRKWWERPRQIWGVKDEGGVRKRERRPNLCWLHCCQHASFPLHTVSLEICFCISPVLTSVLTKKVCECVCARCQFLLYVLCFSWFHTFEICVKWVHLCTFSFRVCTNITYLYSTSSPNVYTECNVWGRRGFEILTNKVYGSNLSRCCVFCDKQWCWYRIWGRKQLILFQLINTCLLLGLFPCAWFILLFLFIFITWVVKLF